jgi:hypothetical protein
MNRVNPLLTKFFRLSAILMSLALCTEFAYAQVGSDIPSCYKFSSITASNKAPDVELFVLIDQTTPFNKELQQQIANQVKPFMRSGAAFSVFQFSAYTQGKYTTLLAGGQLDDTLDKQARDDTSKAKLTKFDQCLNDQTRFAAGVAGKALQKAFGGISNEIAKSDILASLKEISSRIQKSPAKQKIVLLASDMLENSAISSFYAKQTVRRIDPVKELDLALKQDMQADFDGAKIFVLGAGLLAEDAKNGKGKYRGAPEMNALRTFWHSYFAKSNAQLVEFGQPSLLNQIK